MSGRCKRCVLFRLFLLTVKTECAAITQILKTLTEKASVGQDAHQEIEATGDTPIAIIISPIWSRVRRFMNCWMYFHDLWCSFNLKSAC